MPELPEVETVVRDLRRKIVGRRITAVWTDWPKMIKDCERQDRLHVSKKAVAHFNKHIVGLTIERVERRAKNILIYLSEDHLMLVHQKMTGHFLMGEWKISGGKAVGISPREIIEDSYNHHVHLIFDLSAPAVIASTRSNPGNKTDGLPRRVHLAMTEGPIQLGLSDVRKFAKVLFGKRQQIEALPELVKLGPDALDPELSIEQFARIVQSRQRLGGTKLPKSEGRPIKQVLMDRAVIAGIGNIYSDDILWRAKVHPKRRAKDIKAAELSAIFRAMRSVLAKAVRLRGTSTSDFRDTAGKEGGYTEYRLVYQRKGQSCRRCKTSINRIVVGGRSAHFCPACQSLPAL